MKMLIPLQAERLDLYNLTAFDYDVTASGEDFIKSFSRILILSKVMTNAEAKTS